jgi:hypothetical protein
VKDVPPGAPSRLPRTFDSGGKLACMSRSMELQCFHARKTFVELLTELDKAEAQRANPIAQLEHVQPTQATLTLADVRLPKAQRVGQRLLRHTLPRAPLGARQK